MKYCDNKKQMKKRQRTVTTEIKKMFKKYSIEHKY